MLSLYSDRAFQDDAEGSSCLREVLFYGTAELSRLQAFEAAYGRMMAFTEASMERLVGEGGGELDKLAATVLQNSGLLQAPPNGGSK